ncbi:hypothetical protein H7F16_18335 [Gemmobacter straminiformis]|uniref:Uncharacterized protein n=2 Tax=Paragemmobacter straminiformis TaxID=2045119 RepID=A0A842IBT6_9RHOB|nr:hypothetical protein [Gemmobacter straminiformis]
MPQMSQWGQKSGQKSGRAAGFAKGRVGERGRGCGVALLSVGVRHWTPLRLGAYSAGPI